MRTQVIEGIDVGIQLERNRTGDGGGGNDTRLGPIPYS